MLSPTPLHSPGTNNPLLGHLKALLTRGIVEDGKQGHIGRVSGLCQLSKRVLSIFTPSEKLVPEVLVAVAEGSQESPAVNYLEGGWISYHPGTIGSG